MYIYAELNEREEVKGFLETPTAINTAEFPHMVKIPELDESLWGAVHQGAGVFIRMSCYAIVKEESIVDVIKLRSDMSAPMGAIAVPFADRGYIGCKCINGEIITQTPTIESLESMMNQILELLPMIKEVLHERK